MEWALFVFVGENSVHNPYLNENMFVFHIINISGFGNFQHGNSCSSAYSFEMETGGWRKTMKTWIKICEFALNNIKCSLTQNLYRNK